MRSPIDRCLPRVLGLSCTLLFLAATLARGADGTAEIVDSTWVDHDRSAIQRPPDWEPSYWGRRIHQGVVEPLAHLFDIPDKLLWIARGLGAHTRREAVNVNAFDEVPNSSWFTNRNHMRAVPVTDLRQGPDSLFLPTKPWTIKHVKQGGWSEGFQIKDADGKKWLVKLDPRGYPQLSAGSDMISRTLLHAAGYNVPHNEPVRFRRDDVVIDSALANGPENTRFTDADLDSLLARGAVFPDSSFSAFASLFIPDALGSPSMNRLRPGDSNDWYSHIHRRELRGLFVLCSWINDWDTEDHQFLDAFAATRDSLGHVDHYVLDVGSSFGASANGPKEQWWTYESMPDFAWIGRRLVTLGFVEEPWRRAHQETGIPSVGNYESEAYRPQNFTELVPQPAFRERTDRDGYWGAKIVASFSDAQIAAAVDAAHYEDPRAPEYQVRNLIVRRDKIARYWFGRVAPLDFFSVDGGALHFHDLAVDVGLTSPRAYEIEVETTDGPSPGRHRVQLSSAELPLTDIGDGVSHLSLEISVAGNPAKPAHVELVRKDSEWIVTRVRHG